MPRRADAQCRPRSAGRRAWSSTLVAAPLLAVLGAGGCRTSTDVGSGAQEDSRPTEREEDKGDPKIAVACVGGEGIPAATRSAVESTARGLTDAVRQGQLDQVWGALHPQASREDQRKNFMEALASMQQRLQDTKDAPARVEAIHFVDVVGGANDLARVRCGDSDDPMAFTWTANVGGEDIALVRLLVGGEVFAHAVTVQLRQRGEVWRLVGIQVNPAEYRGRNALAFETLGDEYARAQKMVPAYLALGVAQTLASRGASITSALEQRIKQKLDAVKNNQAFEAHLSSWTVDGQAYHLHGLSLASTQSDISPVFKYVTPGGLVPEILGTEADKLSAHVRTAYPELAEQFDAVVFEAYAIPPTEPGKTYDAYRTARFLDPARNAG